MIAATDDRMLIVANTITADMGMIPGFAFVGPGMGLPLSVLAAFVERPFYSRAGVNRHTIWYSLQANLVSLLVGFAAMLLAVLLSNANPASLTAWPLLAVCVSIVIERWYLQRRVRPVRVSWGWTAVGNVVSAALCVGVALLVADLRSHFPGLRGVLHSYVMPLEVFAFVGSAALFVVAFLQPRKRSVAKDVAVAT
jgi:hypothetical protein